MFQIATDELRIRNQKKKINVMKKKTGAKKSDYDEFVQKKKKKLRNETKRNEL